METIKYDEDYGFVGENMTKVLIATIYTPDPVLLACTRLSPERLILLISEESNEIQKESLDLIKNSLGRVMDIKIVKIPVYDIVKIAKKVVDIIDMQPKDDSIFLNITSGRKTQSMGVLFGAYARSKLVKKITYLTEEDKKAINLPILSIKLNESQKNILEALEKNTIKNYAELAKVTGLSTAMIYRSVAELMDMDFVETTDKGYFLTDAGKIARL